MKFNTYSNLILLSSALLASTTAFGQPAAGAGAGGRGGRGGRAGGGGAAPGAALSASQQAAVAAIDQTVAAAITSENEARQALVTASFAATPGAGDIQAKATALRTAEQTLADARATEFGKLQASTNKLSAELVQTLVAQAAQGGRGLGAAGAPAAGGGRGGRGGAAGTPGLALPYQPYSLVVAGRTRGGGGLTDLELTAVAQAEENMLGGMSQADAAAKLTAEQKAIGKTPEKIQAMVAAIGGGGGRGGRGGRGGGAGAGAPGGAAPAGAAPAAAPPGN